MPDNPALRLRISSALVAILVSSTVSAIVATGGSCSVITSLAGAATTFAVSSVFISVNFLSGFESLREILLEKLKFPVSKCKYLM